jgi:hypothetical protein
MNRWQTITEMEINQGKRIDFPPFWQSFIMETIEKSAR